MIKKNKKYLIAICILLNIVLPIKEVFAETATLNVIGDWIAYNQAGIYTGRKSDHYHTKRKTLTDQSGVNYEAYCVQYGKSTPDNGAKMSLVDYGAIAGQNWTEDKAIKAGAIIDYVNSLPNLDQESKIVYIHTALNKYLRFSSSVTTYNNTILNETISHADSKVFYKNSKLTETTVQVKFQKNILDKGTNNGKTYYYGNATINIANNYPSYVGEITYTPSCTNCKLYTDSKMTTEVTSIKVAPGKKSDVTYFVRTTDNLGASTKINLTVNASKKFTYSTAKLWYQNSYRQMVMTASPITYTGTIKTTATATTPSAKKVTFYKINSIGDELAGANVKVELNTTDGRTIGSCTTNGQSECSFNFTDNISKVNYTITELTSPNGYIKESPITKEWQIGTTSNTCYKVPIENKNGEWTQASVTDCETSYLKKEVCLDKDNKLISNIEDSNTCVKDNTPPEEDKEIDKGDNTLGGEEDGSGSEGDDGSLENGSNSGEEGNDGNDSGLESQNMREEQEEGFGSEGDDSKEEDKTEEIINNKWESKCLNNKNEIVDDSKCNYDYTLLSTSGTSLSLEMTNTLNSVKISKVDKTEKNIEGAKLKICEENTYKEKNTKCEAYTTVNETKLAWYTSLANETFYGFKPGKYYIIEEKAPLGYKFDNTVIEFNIDEYGKVSLAKDSKAKLEDNKIIFENEITSFSISKQDIATSKELKGATLSICSASNAESENGEYELTVSDTGFCEPVVLANGEFAEWVSTDKPYVIKGLAAGAYYLVEKIAPTDYTTAESILFFMEEDGTLTDKDGNLLKDSKIVMYDKIIEGPKTKDIALFTIISFILVSLTLSTGSYRYLQSNKKI